MSSTSDIILDYICPGIGVIMATATFAAPIRSLQEALDEGSLGNLNPTPWAFMTGNCLGWVAYSYLTKDLFVLFANVPGLLFSIWLNVGAAKLEYKDYFPITAGQGDALLTDYRGATLAMEEDRETADETDAPCLGEEHTSKPSGSAVMPQEKKVLSISFLWIVVLSTVNLGQMPKATRENIVGIVVNINLAFFYGAPLSTIATVVRERSSETIHVRTMMMTLTNTAFWLVYGIARHDPYISIPNGAGFILGCIQALLTVLFSKKGLRRGMQPVADMDNLSDHLIGDSDDIGGSEKEDSSKVGGGVASEIV